MLRKSILGIFGEIVLKLYTGAKQDEAAKNARDQVGLPTKSCPIIREG